MIKSEAVAETNIDWLIRTFTFGRASGKQLETALCNSVPHSKLVQHSCEWMGFCERNCREPIFINLLRFLMIVPMLSITLIFFKLWQRVGRYTTNTLPLNIENIFINDRFTWGVNYVRKVVIYLMVAPSRFHTATAASPHHFYFSLAARATLAAYLSLSLGKQTPQYG